METRPSISPVSPMSSGSERTQVPDAPEVITVARSTQSPRPFDTEYYPDEKIPVPPEESHSPFSAVTGNSTDRAPLQNAPIAAGSDAPEVVPQKSKSRREKLLIIVIALLVLIIALGVGLGVGLKKKHKPERAGDETAPPEETIDPKNYIACNTTLCPQVLSVAQFSNKYYIFGRNSDDRITYKVGWTGENETWTILNDAPANIITQPVAMSWSPTTNDPRLDVFVVTGEGNVWGSHLGSKWWSDWEAMGPYAGSQPVLCRIQENRTDLYTTDSLNHNVSHTWWLNEKDDWWNERGRWDITQSGPAKNAPGAVCRWWYKVKIMQDVVWYDRDERRVWHMSWFRESQGWGTAKSFNGAWIGDPTLVQYSNDSMRVDFLGIQEDRHMYHFSKDGDKTYSDMSDLGGSFASVPSVTSPKTGIYDVVALGMDGYLHHKRYDNSTGWGSTWDRLDIEAESAPTAIQDDDSVNILYLSKSGGLMRAEITVDDKGQWSASNSSFIGTGMTFKNRFYGDGL